MNTCPDNGLNRLPGCRHAAAGVKGTPDCHAERVDSSRSVAATDQRSISSSEAFRPGLSRLLALPTRPAKASIPASLLLILAVLLTSCSLPGDAAHVVKIGLIAPFEGVGRPLGYAILPEVRQAIAEMNASGELGRYRVALVALNDDLDPAVAAAQARALLQDDAVLAVVGPFGGEPAAAAAPILFTAGLPALVAAPLGAAPQGTANGAPDGATSLCPSPDEIAAALELASTEPGLTDPLVFFPGDAALAADELAARRAGGWQGVMLAGPDVLRSWFIQRAGVAAEGARAVACSLGGSSAPAAGDAPEVSLAGAATRALLQVLAVDIQAHGRPSRAGVAAALSQQTLAPELVWYQVVDAEWSPLLAP